MYHPFLVGPGCIFALPLPLVDLLTSVVWVSLGVVGFGTVGRVASANLSIGLAGSIAELPWEA